MENKPAWLNKEEYPFTRHFFNLDGHQLHYLDEGKGSPIVFVHGTPSWSFDFRHLIRNLSQDFRCIAPDHIGFGLSDKPANYDYSIQNHCLNLEKLIHSIQIQPFILVVHDFGGPIGLYFALKYPHLIRGLIVLNTWMWSSENDPAFLKLRKILKSPLIPFLYRYLNFSPRFLLPQSFGENKLSKHLLSQYTKPFQNPSERFGTLSFARSLLLDQHLFEQLWEQKDRISNKPTLLIWGMKDRMIGPAYLHRFQAGFPNSQTLELESCGHFPQEEESEKVVLAIRKWLTHWA